ncbi:MAG: hypothetical protein PF636_12670 [Actinomycetota bacterium]|jgi:hypothetical protein|nr:hypothetical protein [Actinomycetota bacterium]
MKDIDFLAHSGRFSRRSFLGMAVVGLLTACSPERLAEVPSADTPSTPTTSPAKDPTPILDVSWAAVAFIPRRRRNLKAVATADKIYATGGYDAAGNYADSNYEYDPVADTWQVRASLPTARSNMAVGSVGDKVYAIGGDPFQHINCDVLNGKLYVIGGLSRQGVSDKNTNSLGPRHEVTR